MKTESIYVHADTVVLNQRGDFVLTSLRGKKSHTWIYKETWFTINKFIGKKIPDSKLVEINEQEYSSLIKTKILTDENSDEKGNITSFDNMLKTSSFFGRVSAPSEKTDCTVLNIGFESSNNISNGVKKGAKKLKEVSKIYEPEMLNNLEGLRGWIIPDLWEGTYRILKGKNINCYETTLQNETFSIGNKKFLDDLSVNIKSVAKENYWIVGGDHSITYAGIQALYYERGAPITLIYFDAHLDAEKPVDGNMDNANFIGYLLESNYIEEIYQIGNRSVVPYGPSHITHPKLFKINSIDEIDNDRLYGKKIYCSIDLDVLDPSVASAVSAPVPNGWSLKKLEKELHNLNNITDIKSGDVVEYQPKKDTDLVTAQIIIRITLICLGFLTDSIEHIQMGDSDQECVE